MEKILYPKVAILLRCPIDIKVNIEELNFLGANNPIDKTRSCSADLICALRHFGLDPMEVFSQLHEPLVVIFVLGTGADELSQARHDGSHRSLGVLVRLPGVERVALQCAVPLLQALVGSILAR